MYKLEIELGWQEKLTIETDDFNKIALIQEFIAEQEELDWEVDLEDDECFVDEDGIAWVYVPELDEWVVYEGDDEEEEDEEDYE